MSIFPYTFAVGEVAILMLPAHPQLNHQECTVVAPLAMRDAVTLDTNAIVHHEGYLVETPAHAKYLHVHAYQLRKKKPPEEKVANPDQEPLVSESGGENSASGRARLRRDTRHRNPEQCEV